MVRVAGRRGGRNRGVLRGLSVRLERISDGRVEAVSGQNMASGSRLLLQHQERSLTAGNAVVRSGNGGQRGEHLRLAGNRPGQNNSHELRELEIRLERIDEGRQGAVEGRRVATGSHRVVQQRRGRLDSPNIRHGAQIRVHRGGQGGGAAGRRRGVHLRNEPDFEDLQQLYGPLNDYPLRYGGIVQGFTSAGTLRVRGLKYGLPDGIPPGKGIPQPPGVPAEIWFLPRGRRAFMSEVQLLERTRRDTINRSNNRATYDPQRALAQFQSIAESLIDIPCTCCNTLHVRENVILFNSDRIDEDINDRGIFIEAGCAKKVNRGEIPEMNRIGRDDWSRDDEEEEEEESQQLSAGSWLSGQSVMSLGNRGGSARFPSPSPLMAAAVSQDMDENGDDVDDETEDHLDAETEGNEVELAGLDDIESLLSDVPSPQTWSQVSSSRQNSSSVQFSGRTTSSSQSFAGSESLFASPGGVTNSWLRGVQSMCNVQPWDQLMLQLKLMFTLVMTHHYEEESVAGDLLFITRNEDDFLEAVETLPNRLDNCRVIQLRFRGLPVSYPSYNPGRVSQLADQVLGHVLVQTYQPTTEIDSAFKNSAVYRAGCFKLSTANDGGGQVDDLRGTNVRIPSNRPISALYDNVKNMTSLLPEQVIVMFTTVFHRIQSIPDVTTKQLARFFLNSADKGRVAASNLQFIFAMYKLAQSKNIEDTRDWLSRRRGRKETKEAAIQAMIASSIDDVRIEDVLYRNGPKYWKGVDKKLGIMVDQFGSPNLFLTLSSNHINWRPLLKTLLKAVGEKVQEIPPGLINWDTDNLESDEVIDRLTDSQKWKLIQADPVLSTRYFERLSCGITTLLVTNKVPFGPSHSIAHYFFKTEFTARGDPHLHILLWIPSLGPMDDPNYHEDLASFVSRHVSTEHLNCQQHSCSDNCLLDARGDRRAYGCKHGYPRLPVQEPCVILPLDEVLTDDQKGILQAQLCRAVSYLSRNTRPQLAEITMNGFWDEIGVSCQDEYTNLLRFAIRNHPQVMPRRSVANAFTNPYNPVLQGAWNGHMDIKVVSPGPNLTTYVAKAPSAKLIPKLLSCANQERLYSNSMDVQMQRVDQALGLESDGKRMQICAPEAIYILLGYPLIKCDLSLVFISTVHKKDRIGVRKTLQELQDLPSDSTSTLVDSNIDHYEARPREFEDKTLIWFMSNSHFQGYRRGDRCHQLNDGSGFMKVNRPRLVHTEEFSEGSLSWYRQQLLLFVPFRSEEKDMLLDDEGVEAEYYKYLEVIQVKRAEYLSAFDPPV